MIAALATLDTLWDQLLPAEQNRLLHLLIERIDVDPDGFHLRLRAQGLRGLVDELSTTPAEAA